MWETVRGNQLPNSEILTLNLTLYREGVRLVEPRTTEVFKEEVKLEFMSYEAEIRL